MSRKLTRFALPPLVIAFSATAALVTRDDEPVFIADDAPIVAPASAIEAGSLPEGLALGPAEGAPELIVVDELIEEPAQPVSRRAPTTDPGPVAETPAVGATPHAVASEALAFEEAQPSLALRAPDPRRSVRIDARRDTALGGISTVSDREDRGRRGIRFGITVGDGCRTSPSTALVFDRGAGLDTRSIPGF